MPNIQAPPPFDAPGILRGAMIACEDGNMAIEAVKTGDIVNTLSDGPQVVRWVGHTNLCTAAVQILAGALAENTPSQDLLVMPAQRMVVSGWQAEVLFGEAKVLVSAEALVNEKTICLISPPSEPTLFHILFDKHEVVSANGAPTESFYPTKSALSRLPFEAQSALATQVPELRGLDPIQPFALVHPAISAAEAALLR